MSAKKSPFVPLLRLREEHADNAARRLASAQSDAERAGLLAAQRAAERRGVEAEVAMTEAELQASTERGVRAGDLAQGADWRRGADARRKHAESLEGTARQASSDAEEGVRVARDAVSTAEADVDAAATLLERERRAQARKEAAALEEAAEEAFLARARRGRS